MQIFKSFSNTFVDKRRIKVVRTFPSKVPRKCFNLKLPARVVKSAPPLTPLLGQFGLNSVEFCNNFNEQSKVYEENVLLFVKVFLLGEKKYKLLFRELGTVVLFQSYTTYIRRLKRPFVHLIDLFKIFLIKNQTLNISLKSLIGTIRSMGFGVLFDNMYSILYTRRQRRLRKLRKHK